MRLRSGSYRKNPNRQGPQLHVQRHDMARLVQHHNRVDPCRLNQSLQQFRSGIPPNYPRRVQQQGARRHFGQ